MLQQGLIEKILDYGLSHGADFTEVFAEDVSRSFVSMSGEKITDMVGGREQGVGIRLFFGDQLRYFYSEELEESALFRKMSALCRDRSGTVPVYRSGLTQKRKYTMNGAGASWTQKANLLKKCNLAGKEASDFVMSMDSSYQDMDQRVLIANSEGCYVEDRRQKTRLFIDAIAKDNGEIRSSYVGPGAMAGFEFYETIDPEAYARQAAKQAESLLHAKPCPVGRMPIVIANGFGGLFFHEVCGHSLEATGAAYDASEFSGRFGQKIASSKVTLIDDGSMADEWGSLHVDDEGIPTQKNTLIENGILRGYLVDRWNGRKLHMAPTGSSRRQSYRFAPTSRMTNTYIAPGTDKLDEMIRDVDQGLFVRNIYAGSVHPATGEFNFNTREAFLIENGKITVPVREATLIGTGGEILHKVDRVASDYKMGQGFCYSESGALFIGAGQPAVRISDITVGGDDV